MIVQLVQAEHIVQGRRLRVDTTVATNIHYPTDSSLLGDGVRVLTRTMLLERVWDFHFDPQTSVVETHMSRLRAKIDKPFEEQLLHTIRHTGYSLHA